MSQFDLFAVKDDAAPNIYTPEPDNIRARLLGILEEMRSAETMPWDRSRSLMYKNIFPQMTNWLPPEEAEQFKSDFAAELRRLDTA